MSCGCVYTFFETPCTTSEVCTEANVPDTSINTEWQFDIEMAFKVVSVNKYDRNMTPTASIQAQHRMLACTHPLRMRLFATTIVEVLDWVLLQVYSGNPHGHMEAAPG
jgi:hypothetical protein